MKINWPLEKLLPCRKTKQRKFFVIFFCRFVDSGIVKKCDELNLWHVHHICLFLIKCKGANITFEFFFQFSMFSFYMWCESTFVEKYFWTFGTQILLQTYERKKKSFSFLVFLNPGMKSKSLIEYLLYRNLISLHLPITKGSSKFCDLLHCTTRSVNWNEQNMPINS